MGLYRSPLSLSDALEFLSSIERSIREHKSDITVDIRVLANNEYVLYISPDGYYIWNVKDWEHYARKHVYKRRCKNDESGVSIPVRKDG